MAHDGKGAAERLDPVGEPAQPGAPGRICAPDAVVRDLNDRTAVAAADRDGDTGGGRVLGHVGQRLRDDVVRGRLDGIG